MVTYLRGERMSLHLAIQQLIESLRASMPFVTLEAAEQELANDPQAITLAHTYHQLVTQINQLSTHDSDEAKSLKKQASEAKIARDQLPTVSQYLRAYQQVRTVLTAVNSSLFDEFFALHQGQTCVTRK